MNATDPSRPASAAAADARATTDGRSARSVFGIKTKLFLAFFIMAGFTILASAIAWYAFDAIERSVRRITGDSVPAMTVSMRLAEKSAEIAATAPALIASASQEERIGLQAQLEERATELAGLVRNLEASAP